MRISRRALLAGGAALGAGLPAFAAQQEPQAVEKPKFKLGTVTYNIAKDWDLPTLIAHCKASRFEGVELRTTHRHGVEPSLPSEQRREVRARFADSGVTLWGLGTVCEFQSPDAAVVRQNVEDCKRWCELAKDVGAHGVKVRPNGLPKDVSLEKTLEQIGTTLRECGDAAKSNGVEIWVEVHGGITQEPANMRRILDVCGHPSVGACWNSNPTDVKAGSVKAAFNLLKKDIRSCHINDLWGDYPYRELFGLFREARYDRFTLCEVGKPVNADSGAVFLSCYRGLWEQLQRP